MMLYPPMNQLTANVPNRYLLVNVVARRARQIAQEAEDAVQDTFLRYGKRGLGVAVPNQQLAV